MRTRTLTVALAAALLLSGCGSNGSTGDQNAAQGAATSAAAGGQTGDQAGGASVIDTTKKATAAAPAVKDPMLAKYGLDGKSVVEIVDDLDETNAHRGSGLKASIRPDHLQLEDESAGTRTTIPVPDDLFYMSVAPYATQTHECVNHSLTGCKGELPKAAMTAKVTKDDGTVLYEGPATTFENGFVGFWLPRDIRGTMRFDYDGKSVSAPFVTDTTSPTCITTMQLT